MADIGGFKRLSVLNVDSGGFGNFQRLRTLCEHGGQKEASRLQNGLHDSFEGSQ